MKPLLGREQVPAKLPPPRTERNFGQCCNTMAKFIISVLFLYKIKNLKSRPRWIESFHLVEL